MTTTSEIRSIFLDYFKSQNHQVLPCGPLVPANDPTLMFANAGMVQFKDVFIGKRPRPGPRVATVQKCIRISGKHNDLENVGPSPRHHTFFEMLGNFSFGDYFKEDACRFGWALLTEGYGFDPDRLWVTVFAGDDAAPADEETERIWREKVGVPAERIQRLGAADNFWAMGETGPCGPCSEIHFDRGPDFGPDRIENDARFFELWNLVFMQYQVEAAGENLKPLPSPCIDTGAGLERIASILQGVQSNYDIDIFKPIIASAAGIAKRNYGDSDADDTSLRVIADHARMTAFLIAEGIFPDKTGREYVLRRVMRRAIRHGHRLGIEDLFMHRVAGQVIDTMHAAYPELAEHASLIDRICQQEEGRFRETLDRGLTLLKENTNWLVQPDGKRVLPGDVAFDLTATYGFPKDLIAVIGREEGSFTVDEAGYQAAEDRHKAVSGSGKIGEAALAPIYADLKNSLGETAFTGYRAITGTSQVLAIIQNSSTAEQAHEGDHIEVILGETPFYGESGGQVGDIGTISSPQGTMAVTDTQVPIPGLYVHKGTVLSGRIRVTDEITAAVDEQRRGAIRKHHTATHLLHLALRQVLGAHATQKGSRVDPDGLRFDFSHFEPLSQAEKLDIEARVIRKISEAHPVITDVMPYAEAKKQGAMALFGEHYGDQVRMVSVSDESKELCGGTHVASSSDIGLFFITDEMGIAAGVRRIEAVAGDAALKWIRTVRERLERTAALLKVAPLQLEDRIKGLLTRERTLLKEVDTLKRKLASEGANTDDAVQEIAGVKVMGVRIDIGEPATLRETADRFRHKLGSGVVCLGGENNGKAALVVAVTDDLTKQLRAGDLIREVTRVVGGKGGGRPDFAQGGGPDPAKLDQAIAEIYTAVDQRMKVSE
ncbi:MAG: alanine--tRNA ligase [Myxococcota bacterium]|nr:alanine--tRNA ligase [Myxococcota bacterium]